MTRTADLSHKIALLATGDEIITGDILNTNTQQIAIHLTENNLHVGMHHTSRDVVNDIKDALISLLKDHDCVIMTGGLGPTSDDLTRYALAESIQKPLIFHNQSWQNICDRLKKFGIDNPPESNRQQALFPENAEIIPNDNGTAAGCYIQINQKIIFMLPGPPTECLPMIQSHVLPILLKNNFAEKIYAKKWFLLGASEGKIAEALDELIDHNTCLTGYRIAYPYVEFKLYSKNEAVLKRNVAKVKGLLQDFIIEDGAKTASTLLKERILKNNLKISILDRATAGLLENTLRHPITENLITFHDHENQQYKITVSGLSAYWQNQTSINKDILNIKFGKEPAISITLPLRDKRILLYAVESTCHEILKMITRNVIS